MAARFLLRTGSKVAAAGTVVAGGTAAVAIVTSDDPSTTFKICTKVPLRLLRDSFTAATIAFDYEYSLWGLPEGSIERSRAKHEVHTRCAQRLQELCFRNGGIYIKLGQHIGQLTMMCLPPFFAVKDRIVWQLPPTYQGDTHFFLQLITEYIVPQEYLETMRASMLNRCPVSSYEQVCAVFKKELGRLPNEIFVEFDPVPLASASLAQVHAAQTHDGRKVAVKIQHTHMTDTALADYATVELLVNVLHWCFPAFDYRWLVDEMRESLPKELDFVVEAKNSEKCLDNFRRLSPHLADYVYAPKVFWNLSTSKLLTMEFMDGAEITDVNAIQRLGLQPKDVAKLVSQVFAEMIFKHGFVHCDPHAANLFVRPLPSGKRNILGKRKPQLILLDHGLYKDLDLPTRLNYAALWKALIFADANAIKENSVKLGAGEDLYALFAGILTMKPWNRVVDPAVDHLLLQGNDSDRSELQMYASQYFPQISELLSRLPRVILLMLKTNDCLRTVNHSLGSTLDTFLIIGRVSAEAVAEMKKLQRKSFLSGISLWLEEILLEARLLGMQIACWILQLRKALSG